MSGIDSSRLLPGPITGLTTQIVETQDQLRGENERFATHERHKKFSEGGHEMPAIASLGETLRDTTTKLDMVGQKLIEDGRTRGSLELTEDHTDYFAGLFASRDKFSLDDFQNDVRAIMESVQDLLNAKMSGRYLFAGSMDDAPPVDITQLKNPHTYALDDTDIQTDPTLIDYYQGDNVVRKDEHGKPETLLASDPIFQNMFKVFNLFVGLDKTHANYNAEVAEIERLLPDVSAGLVSLQKQQAYIEGRHRSDSKTLKEHQRMEGVSYAEMTKVNPSEVFIRIEELNRRLQGWMGLTKSAMRNQSAVVQLATGSAAAAAA